MKNNTFKPKQYRRQDISKKLQTAGFYPLDVMVTGVTGAGKSTTLNTLFHKQVAEVGEGCDPMTMTLDSYSLHDKLRFWDTPGLGDGVQQDIEHSKKMIDLLHKTYTMDNNTYGFIDMVIIVIEGSNRDMGSTYQLINDIILNNIEPQRVMIAINKADIAMKGRGWDHKNKQPLPILTQFLEQQAQSIQKRIIDACGLQIQKPIYYSADQFFNIQAVMDQMINTMPESRRQLILPQCA